MAEHRPVVIDYGSFNLSAGFGGDDCPRAIIPAKIGCKRSIPLGGNVETAQPSIDEPFLGNNVYKTNQDSLVIKYAVERGDVVDWDNFENVLHHCYFSELLTSPETQPLLLTDCIKHASKNREKLIELAFESFAVPKLCIANTGMLSLLSTGRMTGLVLACGHGITSAVPIIDGQIFSFATMHLNLAGTDVTYFLAQLLGQHGYSFTKPSDFDNLRVTKEAACFVKLGEDPSANAPDISMSEVVLSRMDLDDRWKATEILFNPSLLGDYAKINYGLHELVHESINRCDQEIRAQLASNIVVCGGTSMLPGFAERLTFELKQLTDLPVNVTAMAGRQFAAWIGGSIFSTIENFEYGCASLAEYEEEGANVSRKYF